MRHVFGVITIVQEGRFRLVDDHGHPWHFELSAAANVEPQDLPPLMRADHRVRVSCTRAKGLIAFVAHTVTPQRGAFS